MQSHPTGPTDRDAEDDLTFTDVTTLVFLAAAAATLAVVLLLGTVSAVHRIAAVIGAG